GDIENGSTGLSGQIYPISGAQRFHPTSILNEGIPGSGYLLNNLLLAIEYSVGKTVLPEPLPYP
ncbi:hypothetical protein, partial [Shewanella chilikensis]|uniref:hypothetical protein n=1 Tax=Shewanella chilikensis TaxID=558541 RepID=UPI003999A439